MIIKANKNLYLQNTTLSRILLILLQIIIYMLVVYILNNHPKERHYFEMVFPYIGVLIAIITYYFLEFTNILLQVDKFPIVEKSSSLGEYLIRLVEAKPDVIFKYVDLNHKIVSKKILFDNIIDTSDKVDSLDLSSNTIFTINLIGEMDYETEVLYKKRTKRVLSNTEIEIPDYKMYLFFSTEKLKYYSKVFYVICVLLCIAEYYKFFLMFNLKERTFNIRKQLYLYQDINIQENTPSEEVLIVKSSKI